MKRIALIVLCAFLASCLHFGIDKGTKIPNDAPGASLLPPPMSTTQITETSTFEIKTICPTSRIKSFDNLGVPIGVQLAMVGVNENSRTDYESAYSLLSPDSPEPKIIQGITAPIGLENRAYSISPDGYWIKFSRVEKTNFETEQIIISSLNGANKTFVTHLKNPNQVITWLSNGNKLVVWGDPNAKSGDPYDWLDAVPLAIINPDTLESESPESFPLNKERYPGMKEVFEDDLSLYILYSYGGMPFDEFVLYSYATKSKTQVFQWLTGIDTLFFDNTSFFLQDNTFSVLIEKPYGLDIAIGLTLEDIKRVATYDQIMEKLVLPDEALPLKFPIWNLEKNSILFFNGEKLGDSVSHKLFSLDVKRKLIYDYCFKMPEDFNRIHLSPDGNFVAFSSPTERSSRITIVNLETGYLSVLENYDVIGWGRK